MMCTAISKQADWSVQISFSRLTGSELVLWSLARFLMAWHLVIKLWSSDSTSRLQRNNTQWSCLNSTMKRLHISEIRKTLLHETSSHSRRHTRKRPLPSYSYLRRKGALKLLVFWLKHKSPVLRSRLDREYHHGINKVDLITERTKMRRKYHSATAVP